MKSFSTIRSLSFGKFFRFKVRFIGSVLSALEKETFSILWVFLFVFFSRILEGRKKNWRTAKCRCLAEAQTFVTFSIFRPRNVIKSSEAKYERIKSRVRINVYFYIFQKLSEENYLKMFALHSLDMKHAISLDSLQLLLLEHYLIYFHCLLVFLTIWMKFERENLRNRIEGTFFIKVSKINLREKNDFIFLEVETVLTGKFSFIGDRNC